MFSINLAGPISRISCCGLSKATKRNSFNRPFTNYCEQSPELNNRVRSIRFIQWYRLSNQWTSWSCQDETWA